VLLSPPAVWPAKLDFAVLSDDPVFFKGEDFDGTWVGTYDELSVENLVVNVWVKRWCVGFARVCVAKRSSQRCLSRETLVD